ncbi:unnamed protein product [Adineta steineri]|uniref:FYVE-type domain-containing protein n=1 Tax=Adineta steineri TaxID=433720 RepID=A0A813U109_9BILA|nr:unnamed protein product [Adineta steineri]CAF1237216.1 unnamed protein product [Adineta steineri]
MYPDLPSNSYNTDSDKYTNCSTSSAILFEDIKLDEHDSISPNQYNTSTQSKILTPNTSQRRQQERNLEKQISNTDHQQNPSDTKSNGVFLLLDANEHLTVNNKEDFISQLQSPSPDPLVKCVSIIGNTGDGKSYTLNQVFFNGEEKFDTSSTSDSCTMGVWSALDENHRTLVLDTEGRLGLSQNDNIRNRLLLKILCISDIVIFRTRAAKLPNDMFQFLSDASNAFHKYFRKELENVMKSCNVDGPMSTMGPTLIVFHETNHTEVLRGHFQCQKTAVEQLKERFEKMKLSYDAYSSIEYVGIQSVGGKQTDFSEIKATITSTLENNKIRSPRRLSTIFKALQALNEKFNHVIPPEMPSTLPDDFFTCCVKCLSCGIKCSMAANHQKENIPHQCEEQCLYNRGLDNEILKCLQCHREGRDTIVYAKLTAANDNLVQGIVKTVWSGFIIECSHHGEIYRSRKYWYGNNEPKDVTRVEVIHVWPGEDHNRLGSDVTPRKIIEAISSAGSYLSSSTKVLTETVADQIAPSYWIPNKDVQECSSCKLQFGSNYSKHHCRACGHIFCDTCTKNRAIVPLLDTKKAERVCDNCYHELQSQTLSSIFQNNHLNTQQTPSIDYGASNTSDVTSPNVHNIPMSRRFLELFKDNVGSVIYNYLVEPIKESTRPNYWRRDSECCACFICQHEFDNTTYRLHHCRKCGEGVCDMCSPNKRAIPERDWLTPERICKSCDKTMNE